MKTLFLLAVAAPLWAQTMEVLVDQDHRGGVPSAAGALYPASLLAEASLQVQSGRATLRAIDGRRDAGVSVPVLQEVARRPWQVLRISQAALVGATVLDCLSSRGLVERNPILGRGDFRIANQGAKALGFTGALVVAETLIVRKFPKAAKVFRIVNFGGTAAHGAAAVSNFKTR